MAHSLCGNGTAAQTAVSALPYVKDVNRDPVIVFDGLTKGFRYPGWRAGWAIGPKYLIEMINRAASAVDGGPSTMVQRAVIEELAPGHAEAELLATRKEFAVKRKMMMEQHTILPEIQVITGCHLQDFIGG